MKVLIVNEMASVASTMAKYIPYIDVITDQKNLPFRTFHSRTINFKSQSIRDRVGELQSLDNSYDMFLALGWQAAICCLLANVQFGILFVGSDIRYPPFYPFFKRGFSYNMLSLYALRYASFVVAAGPDLHHYLKHYRKDSIYIPLMVDLDLFNPFIPEISLPYDKFTILVPHRVHPQKGYKILWAAIRKTKSDFVALQIDRVGNQLYYSDIVSSLPKKVKLIPIIPRDKISSYYISSDLVIGNGMIFGVLGSVAREAAACHVPVLAYSRNSYLMQPNPFVPKKNIPIEIAKIIDRFVQDSNFRLQLAEREHKYVINTFNPYKISKMWNNLFEQLLFTSKEKVRSIPFYIISKIISILHQRKIF